MANFKTTIITKKGHALMAKLSANVATMKFTKICSSDFDYSNLNNSELEQVITFKNLKQTVLPDLITVVNTATVKVSATITNTNLSEGYYLRTIGLFALDPDDGEILYSITPTSEADYMAADNGITKSGISLDLLTTISNSENVSLEVDPNATISAETFYNIVGNISDLENGGTNLVDGINKNATQLNEKANDITNYAEFRLTANQSVATGTSTPINILLDNSVKANSNLYSLANGTITVLKDGIYALEGNISWVANNAGFREGRIINSKGDIVANSVNAVSGKATNMHFTCVFNLSASDTVNLQQIQNSGTNIDISASWATSLKIRKVG